MAEADESDGSFLSLHPSLAVITNIDREHLDYYRDIEHIKEAFLAFANIVPFYGATVLCLDDPHAREILPAVKRKTITYGITSPAEWRAEDISFDGAQTRFAVRHRGESLVGAVELHVPGLFNVYNALATIVVTSASVGSLPRLTVASLICACRVRSAVSVSWSWAFMAAFTSAIRVSSSGEAMACVLLFVRYGG